MGHFNKFGGDRGGKGFGGGGGRGFGGQSGPRPRFSATCDKCGRPCEVPFRPTGDRPVFCNDCFKAQGGAGSSFAPKNFGGGQGKPGAGQSFGGNAGVISKGQIDSIISKLDKILSILAPAKVEPATKPVKLEKANVKADKSAGKKEKVPAKKAKTKKK